MTAGYPETCYSRKIMSTPPLAPVRDSRADAVSFESVRKAFDRHVAVDDLSFVVPRGTVYGLLGPNGAGKTTSIRMLMSILMPDAGRIRVLGGAPGADLCDRIGYLPEERGLYPGMKVLDNLVFFASIRGVAPGDARERALGWLDRVGMSDTAPRRLSELSKGNQQKIQFLATVLHDPELLVLDEPFSGLDPVNQDLLRGLVLELSERGRTVILSTHLMDEVERLCSRIALVNAGCALVEGPLDEVKRRYGADTVALEVGGDPAPIAAHPDATEVVRRGRTLEVRLADGADPAAFLADVAGRVPVRRFEVRAPSLHSIFVRLVSGGAAAPTAEHVPAGVAIPASASPEERP
jgi:ABC-2 type transport system ATP-binding protein